jgi:hypothetical protein
VTEVYGVVERLERKFPVTQLCEILNVSRSAYYAWRHDEPGTRRREDNRLRPMIRGIFWEHRRRYGTRRIVAELDARRESCGRRRWYPNQPLRKRIATVPRCPRSSIGVLP